MAVFAIEIGEKVKNLTEKYQKSKRFKQKRVYEVFFESKGKICIFGAGALGISICAWLKNSGIMVSFLCDNDLSKVGFNYYENIPCISYSELYKQKDDVYVIVAIENNEHNKIVNEQLKDFKYITRNPLGISAYLLQDFNLDEDMFVKGVKDNIDLFADDFSKDIYRKLINVRLQSKIIDYDNLYFEDIYCGKQYLVDDIFDFKQINTVIDCGAYTGDTLDCFIRENVGNEFYCFEMDRHIYSSLVNNINIKYKNFNKKIFAFQYGVGKRNETITYISDMGGGSKICKNTDETSEIVTLDNMKFSKKISMIKMDIEGAELDALEGARNLISREHPILAISMYHDFEQFIKIPQYIRQIDSNYKVFVRHHKYTLDDTVCYGIYEK